MSVEIREIPLGGDLRPFLEVVDYIYRDDPMFVRPLDLDLKDRLSKKNPFCAHAEGTCFAAFRNDRCVGRITAQIDRAHLDRYKDEAGFFGFFDTIDDEEVGQALIDAASGWLRQRGMKRMMGPFSLYVNEEVGVLIEGFEHPPVLMMSHSRPYQARVAEACGLTKEKDLFAWRWDANDLNQRVIKAWEEIKALPEVKLRSIDTKNMRREIDAIMRIYNDAWKGKWAMVPALPDEVAKVAQDLKLIVDTDIAFIAEINGEPAGMCIMLPNINEAIKDLRGKLLPFGFAKLLWRIKVKHPKSCRLMMLGVREEFRKNVKRYGGLSAAMYVEVSKRGLGKGYQWAELSWTREDDKPINLGIKSMGSKIYKKYRVYQKALS